MESIIENLAKGYVVMSLLIYGIILTFIAIRLIVVARRAKRSATTYKNLFERENTYKSSIEKKLKSFNKTKNLKK